MAQQASLAVDATDLAARVELIKKAFPDAEIIRSADAALFDNGRGLSHAVEVIDLVRLKYLTLDAKQIDALKRWYRYWNTC